MGGAEGLPKHAGERYGQGDGHRYSKYPAVVIYAVGKSCEVELCAPNCQRDANCAGNAREHHVAAHVAPCFAAYIGPEHLADCNLLGVLVGKVGAHGQQPQHCYDYSQHRE